MTQAPVPFPPPEVPLMLGGNVFGWTADRAASFAVLDCFAQGGGSLLDTADYYSEWVPGHAGGESETIMGQWLRASGRREQMVIATKVGLLPGEGGKGLRASRIVHAAEASLRRLQTDVIDIYFAHLDDPETPFEESLAAFQRLIEAGKVRAIGASNFTAARLDEALAVAEAQGLPAFRMIQPNYNLIVRDVYEGELAALAARRNLAVVPFYGLAGGYLTGKYRDPASLAGNARETWLRPFFDKGGPQILAVMDAIAAETGWTLADIALAWLRRRPGVLAPIASATSRSQMESLLAGVACELDADQTARLDGALSPAAAAAAPG